MGANTLSLARMNNVTNEFSKHDDRKIWTAFVTLAHDLSLQFNSITHKKKVFYSDIFKEKAKFLNIELDAFYENTISEIFQHCKKSPDDFYYLLSKILPLKNRKKEKIQLEEKVNSQTITITEMIKMFRKYCERTGIEPDGGIIYFNEYPILSAEIKYQGEIGNAGIDRAGIQYLEMENLYINSPFSKIPHIVFMNGRQCFSMAQILKSLNFGYCYRSIETFTFKEIYEIGKPIALKNIKCYQSMV